MKIILIGILSTLAFNAYSQSLGKLKKQSASGDANAQVELGDKYFEKGNKPRGLELYREAALKGSIEAMESLGDYYRDDAKDLELAVSWYEEALHKALTLTQGKSIDYNDVFSAQRVLGILIIMHETGVYSSELLLNKGLAVYRNIYKKDSSWDTEARSRANLYKKAEQGDIDALLELASSIKVKKYDYEEAAERRFLWMKAAELGNVSAMLKLAKALYRAFYSKKYGFPSYSVFGEEKDAAEYAARQAINLYKKALRLGSVEAAERLASHYKYGLFYDGERILNANRLLSRSFYNKAAKLGSIEAMMELATAYSLGRPSLLGIRANSEKAIEYYAMMLDATSSEEGRREYRSYRAKGVNFLEDQAGKGNAEANYQLGLLNRKMSGTLYFSIIEKLYFERAAKKGHTKAQIILQGEVESSTPAGASSCLSTMSAV